MSTRDDLLTLCHCCEGIQLLTPVELVNRPGLSTLAYRVGTHARFKASMLAGISAETTLAELTTRRDDDLTIALLDGWAMVLDVLSFYQERIANEAYLRTAVERRSLLELARAIGYELGPGVAASTYLAFTLDDSPGSPQEVVIPAGTRAQSVPGQDELPQPFETGEEVVGRAAWTALRPRLTETQLLTAPIRSLVFTGTDTELRIGDRLLAVDGVKRQVFKVVGVDVETTPPGSTDAGRTTVDVLPADPGATELSPNFPDGPEFQPAEPPGSLPFDEPNVSTYILNSPNWTAAELETRVELLGWSLDQLADYLAAVPPLAPATTLEVYALRVKANIFGYNAPRWGTLPKAWRDTNEDPAAPYTKPWGPFTPDVNRDSKGNLHHISGTVIYLDQAQPAIQPEGWLVLEGGVAADVRTYRVEATIEEARADFGISGKATRVTLDSADDVYFFEFRNTTVYGGPAELTLAELPMEGQVEGIWLELDCFALGLLPGRQVVLRGERADLDGVEAAEVRVVAEVIHSMERGTTRLLFAEPLQYPYKRHTVTLNANLAPATHGETRREVLGGGDAAQPFQRFALRQKPLTYVSAPVPSGGTSTLELRVNDLLWHEAPDFFRLGPEDRKYVLRRADDGTTQVLFGDSVHGARPPTGVENVRAVYRTGTGLAGLLGEDRLTLLATRPLGVREVTNPVPATGAEDPESRDQARHNAPLTVKTLDRVVSLHDFEDFARAFSGIGKAKAAWVWDGARRVVHVTLAAASGDPVEEDSELELKLRQAMDAARDPFVPLRLGGYRQRLFTLQVKLRLHPDHLGEKVLAEVESVLRSTFSFDARDFGQSVARSEVITVVQEVAGVEMVDLEAFHGSPQEGGEPLLAARLDAQPAARGIGIDGKPTILGSELLSLAPGPVSLEVLT